MDAMICSYFGSAAKGDPELEYVLPNDEVSKKVTFVQNLADMETRSQ